MARGWATPLELNLPENIAVKWSQDGDQRYNHGGELMKKVLIATALLFTALPFTFDGVTPAVSKAHAIIGRPFTPLSFAGMHRRAVRRTYGIGANLGYAGYYHRNFGPYAYHRYGYGYPAYGYGYGYPAYGYGYGTGYSYPAYGYGYGTGYYGGYGYAYHPVARHIYARAVGVRRHWRY